MARPVQLTVFAVVKPYLSSSIMAGFSSDTLKCSHNLGDRLPEYLSVTFHPNIWGFSHVPLALCLNSLIPGQNFFNVLTVNSLTSSHKLAVSRC